MSSETPSPNTAAASAPRQFVNYAFFKVDPAWRRLPAEQRQADKEEFAKVVESFRGRAVIVPFSLVGIRGDVDFLLWRIAFDLETLQEMTAKLLATGLGQW